MFTTIIIFCCVGLVVTEYSPDWASLDARPLPSWYDEAKFGIFLHWGVYSVPSFKSEWFWDDWKGVKEKSVVEFMAKNYPPGFEYPDFAPMFKAELFDPKEWAKYLSDSGAKYVVLTSKHHEGFTNWPSKYSWNWNSMDTGPHRDLTGDLATAIRNYSSDIHFGLYYSLFEWFNPLYLQDKANNFTTQIYVSEVVLPQMYELVNGYKPDVLWSDGDWEASSTYWNSTEFLAWLYNESPVKDTVVINDRWGSDCHCKHGGYYTCHDRFNPGQLFQHKYENCMTIQKTSWGYIRNTNISGYLTINNLLFELVTTVSTGGNLLMNLGPNHDGRLMPIFQERLMQMGSWLKNNGEAIYKTRPWKHQNDSINKDVWYTMQQPPSGTQYSDVVYAIFLSWPDNFILELGSVVASSETKATLLGYTGTVDIVMNKSGAQGINVTLPHLPPNTPLQWAWALRLEPVATKDPLSHWNNKGQDNL